MRYHQIGTGASRKRVVSDAGRRRATFPDTRRRIEPRHGAQRHPEPGPITESEMNPAHKHRDRLCVASQWRTRPPLAGIEPPVLRGGRSGPAGPGRMKLPRRISALATGRSWTEPEVSIHHDALS